MDVLERERMLKLPLQGIMKNDLVLLNENEALAFIIESNELMDSSDLPTNRLLDAIMEATTEYIQYMGGEEKNFSSEALLAIGILLEEYHKYLTERDKEE